MTIHSPDVALQRMAVRLETGGEKDEDKPGVNSRDDDYVGWF